MNKKRRATKLELLVLEELWSHAEATVVQVHEAVSRSKRIAPTTIATLLRRLEDKDLVAHRTEDRRFVYRPLVQRRELRRTMIGELVDQLFDGSTAALMSHLVEEGEVNGRQLERLRLLVDERKRGRRSPSGS